jgi:hypothetical protein
MKRIKQVEDNSNNVNDSNIITTDVKKENDYRQLVANIARADMHHDLGDLISASTFNDSKNNNIKAAFDSGLPTTTSVSLSEIQTFVNVIKMSSISGMITDENTLQTALDTVPNCNGDIDVEPCIFDIGIADKTLFKYKVVEFTIICENNGKFKNPDINLSNRAKDDDANFGKNFVVNTKLGEDSPEVAFIVDFSQHHFLQKLTTGEKHDNFRIKYLMTPELVNDPAEKPNIHNSSLFGLEIITGVKLCSYIQSDSENIVYTRFDRTSPSPLNNFFSNYTYTLSPINQVYIKGKASKLISSLNISYEGIQNEKPLTETINDSKAENSITSVSGYLKKIIEKLTTVNNPANRFQFSSKCQQKRGGDWFQALSCIDVKTRYFTQILPIREGPSEITCPVYFVTHDRIAVAYALLNGINVIYIDYYGRIFVFKNTYDPTLIGSGKDIEEILFEGIFQKFFVGRGMFKRNELLNNLIITGNKYSLDRKEYQNQNLINFKNVCNNINNKITTLNFENQNSIGSYQQIVRESLAQLFQLAVERMFILLNFIDITDDLNFIQNSEFNQEYPNNATKEFKLFVNKFSKCINNIQGIQDRFGSAANQQNTGAYQASFSYWTDVNVKKLDVYKSAGLKMLEDIQNVNDKPLTNFLGRIMNFRNIDATEFRNTDSHIFLPFIENIDNDCKEQMLTILTKLIEKNKIYYELVLKSPAKKTRSSNMPQPVLFYNRIANLIYESFIFLKTEESTQATTEVYSEAKAGIIDDDATDAVLIKHDLDEQNLFNSNEGKYPNFTEDSLPDSITYTEDSITEDKIGGGTFIASFSSLNKTTPLSVSSVICNISGKQIYWTLLTNILQGNDENVGYLNKIVNYFSPYFNPDITSHLQEGEEKADTIIEEDTSRNPNAPNAPNAPNGFFSGIWKGGVGGGEDEISDLANFLHKNIDNNTPPNMNDNLLLDCSLGFHPLVPIYAMLTSYFSTLGNQSQDDPFFYTYFTYINVIEKMKEIIETKYLNDIKNPYKVASSYLIGFGLNIMLINSNTSLKQTNEILKVVDMSSSEYSSFSLISDGFAGNFTGAVHQTPSEEDVGIKFVTNIVFNNFLNNEVDFKGIMSRGTSVVNLPGYIELKDRILKLMKDISTKVNVDRSDPIVTARGIVGITSQERAKIAEEANKKYEENLAKGLLRPNKPVNVTDAPAFFAKNSSSNSNGNVMVTSSTSSSPKNRGGKKSYRQKQHKKKTKKYKRTYNKTQKRKTQKRKTQKCKKTRKYKK